MRLLVLTNLAITLLPLGLAYVVIGLAGGPRGFLVPGALALVAGLAAGAATLPARARVARERAARTARARATVVDLELHPYIRVGSLLTVTLTARFAGGTFTRRLRVSPLVPLQPGQAIDVVYDPANPANFESLDHAPSSASRRSSSRRSASSWTSSSARR